MPRDSVFQAVSASQADTTFSQATLICLPLCWANILYGPVS